MGLYFVKTFVEEQGGRVWVESRVGEGTQFYIALPAEGPVYYPGKEVPHAAAY